MCEFLCNDHGQRPLSLLERQLAAHTLWNSITKKSIEALPSPMSIWPDRLVAHTVLCLHHTAYCISFFNTILSKHYFFYFSILFTWKVVHSYLKTYMWPTALFGDNSSHGNFLVYLHNMKVQNVSFHMIYYLFKLNPKAEKSSLKDSLTILTPLSSGTGVWKREWPVS